MIDSQLNNSVNPRDCPDCGLSARGGVHYCPKPELETKTVTVYDPILCNGVWPGTTEMTDAALIAQNQAYQRGAGQRETIMAIWNAMVKAHP